MRFTYNCWDETLENNDAAHMIEELEKLVLKLLSPREVTHV